MEYYQIEYENGDTINEEIIGSERRRSSFVWDYFRPIPGSNTLECTICSSCVGKQVSNLSRHLRFSHDITKESVLGIKNNSDRGRTSRSFIWKYCSKEDINHVRCHLCGKLLYFGGGNTANVTKHLRRKHLDVINRKEFENMSEIMDVGETIETNQNGNSIVITTLSDRKERKGSSYVWKYSTKVSRNIVRCNLCHKEMSFHGTANVITHLQRKHNILGKADDENEVPINVIDKNKTLNNNDISFESGGEKENTTASLNESEIGIKTERRSFGAVSNVWKYCTRISLNVVRCSFCKKNLSYQGTSNLQRHLHRMHNVVTQGRSIPNLDNNDTQYKNASIGEVNIWEYCTSVGDDKTRCTMCNAVFERENINEIHKHITVTHAIGPRRAATQSLKRRRRYSDESSEDSIGYSQDNWSKQEDPSDDNQHQVVEYLESEIKKDEAIYDEIIEEEPDQTNYDEDPFDPNVVQEFSINNPLSPQSSDEDITEHSGRIDRKYTSKRLKKLSEERLRMETEYFRAKAGYYRMQKYLTALQARKVRIEIERINNTDINNAYTISLDMQPNLVTQQI